MTDPARPAGPADPGVLLLTSEVHGAMVAHAYAGLPLEACGLIAGDPATATATAWYPCRNLAESSRVYTLDPKDHLRAELDADDHEVPVGADDDGDEVAVGALQ